MSKCGVFSGPYFPVFSPNTGKHGPENTSYLDTFCKLKKWKVALLEIYIIFSSLLQLSCPKCQFEKQSSFEMLKSSEYVKSGGLDRVRNKNLFPQVILDKKLRTNWQKAKSAFK